MEWFKAAVRDDGSIEVPERWLFLHYYEALTILFRIENALRVFVYVILKNELQDEWCDLSITSDDSQQGTIKTIAKKRIAQAKSFGYLGYPITCPIMHLTSGELIRLITSDAYWKYFNQYFLGSKEIMKNKLDEIGTIRNSLAHFRPLKEGDIDVVKQNSKHVLLAVEKCISEMITCKNVVPTNTEEQWYKELSTVGNDHCTLSFSQSADEKWVRITMKYNCPILSAHPFKDRFVAYRVLNLVSSSVLKHHTILAKYLTCLSERTHYPSMDKEFSANFHKEIILLFDRRMLSEHHSELKAEIETLLSQILRETALIKEDNLAKGKLIESVFTSAHSKKAPSGKVHWSFDIRPFICDVKEEDPPEFWGDFPTFVKDFVAGTHKYPWMPAPVSNEEFPF